VLERECLVWTSLVARLINRMNMKLGSKFFNFLRIKTQLHKRLQRVIVVDSATHSQKDGVEGNRGFLEDGAEAFVLFLCGAQLVMRCHAQSLAATDCLTKQFSWLTVESFYLSCSKIWMASLIDNLLSSEFW